LEVAGEQELQMAVEGVALEDIELRMEVEIFLVETRPLSLD